jgi:bifunctional non-homologous end joining protein LigD
VKTTGGKGLHIVLPIEPKRPWSEVKEFTRSMAEALVVADPSKYTVSMSKAARPGKIFVDYLRNERGATAVVAYSPRARAGAPVALPLDWREVKKTHAGNSATVLDVPAKLKKRKTDPWAELLSTRQSISNEALRAVSNIRAETIHKTRSRAKSS